MSVPGREYSICGVGLGRVYTRGVGYIRDRYTWKE